VEILAFHPRAMTLPSAAYGSLCRIVDHYWLTDCAPLPTQNDELAAIARAHRPTWTHHKAEVLSIFDDITAELRVHRERRLKTLASLKQIGAKGVAGVRERAARQRQARPDTPLAIETAPRATPFGKARVAREALAAPAPQSGNSKPAGFVD
jgi:uncharacterized protein YdaU (DUF1376 family)